MTPRLAAVANTTKLMILILTIGAPLAGFAAKARAYPANFTDTQLIGGTGVLSSPVALAWSRDGSRLFIGELGGRIKVWTGALPLTTAITLSVQNHEEQGLLGLALHPSFPTQPYVYVLYTPGSNPQTGGFQRISRFTLNLANNTLGSELVLHSTLPCGNGYHVAGCLRASPDGYLYATDGENGLGTDYPQQLGRLEGKMIRINLDGTIPASNPFVGTPGARTEIYHRGFRNPFRFAIHPLTYRPFINDVGSNGLSKSREEINTGAPGSNFGWPTYEGFNGGSPPPAGFTNPLYAYVTTAHANAAAITGCTFYTGPGFPAGYTNNFFFLDHTRGRLGRMILDAQGNVVSVNESWGNTNSSTWGAGPVDLCQGPDGALYYTQFSPASVRRVAYTSVVGVAGPAEPMGIALTAAPNPFSTTTRIQLRITEPGPVSVHLYDVSGRRIRVLVDDQLQAGEHSFEWDGRDESGNTMPAGVYLARMDTEQEMLTARVLLTR